jgi:hypothetical protein
MKIRPVGADLFACGGQRHDETNSRFSQFFQVGGRAMDQAVSCRPSTAKARVHPRGISGGQSGTGPGFPPEYFGFPLSISFHWCSITCKNEIFITRVAQYALRLRCVRSICCGALLKNYKIKANRFLIIVHRCHHTFEGQQWHLLSGRT